MFLYFGSSGVWVKVCEVVSLEEVLDSVGDVIVVGVLVVKGVGDCFLY